MIYMYVCMYVDREQKCAQETHIVECSNPSKDAQILNPKC